MVGVITENHCKRILKIQNANFSFESYELKPLVQKSVGGLIGLHYNLRINYNHANEKKTLQLFVKTLNQEIEILYKTSRNLFFFEKEELFFMELLPKFARAGIDINIVPRGYLCEDFFVVLEDLSLSGYQLFPKEKSMDIEHCQACLSAIAKFHASSLLYEIHETKRLEKNYSILDDHADILEDLICSGGDTDGTKYMQESVNGLLALAEMISEDSTNLEGLKSIFSSNESSGFNDLRCVLLHADLWNNNFLFKYDGDQILESKLIDFQTIKYGPPCLDVLQFIYSNTRKALRDDHLNDLLSFYYKELDEIFTCKSILLGDHLSKNEFLESCNIFRVKVKLQSVIDRALTCIPDRVFKEVTETNYYDFLFVNRSKYLVEYFKDIPAYRELITEDIEELKDMVSTL